MIVDYVYSNTRLRIMKGLFLKKNDLETLLGLRDLRDYILFMRQTNYRGIFSKSDRIDVHEIERLLTMNLIKSTDRVIGFSPEHSVTFLDCLLKRYQFECIKLILKSRMSSLSRQELMDRFFIPGVDHIFSYKALQSKFFRHKILIDEEFLPKLIDAPIENIKVLLCDKYPDLDEFIQGSGLLDIIPGLDRYYFSETQKCVNYLKGMDRKIASKYIAMEMDIENIMIILRAVVHGYEFERFIIHGHSYYLGALDKYISDNIAEILTKLSKTVYGDALKDAVPIYTKTGSLLHVELALKRYLAEENKRVMYQHPFRIGFILGFLRLKEIEIENLRAISIGINENLPADRIKELLIMSSS